MQASTPLYRVVIRPQASRKGARPFFDRATQLSFDDKARAEQFCESLNIACVEERFEVVEVKNDAGHPAARGAGSI